MNRKRYRHAGGAHVARQTEPVQLIYQQIKLALDVHAGDLMVVRTVDGAKPQLPQKVTTERYLEWVAKQKAQAREVISCDEAGPTRFWLYRQLTALGICNYVVCPTCLDERHAGVNNDRTDALELAIRLDRFVAGNDQALTVVRVPSEAEEQKRARKRQRQQLREQRLGFAVQGRSLMLLHGHRENNHWWKPSRWEDLKARLSAWLIERLEISRQLMVAADAAVRPQDPGTNGLGNDRSLTRPRRSRPISPAPLTFRKTARDPFKFLAGNGRLIAWARSFSDPLTVTDITMTGGRSLERLTRIAGRDVRLDDGHTVGKTFVGKVLGSMRGRRFPRIGCGRVIDFKMEGNYKNAPIESDVGDRPRPRPPSFLRLQVF